MDYKKKLMQILNCFEDHEGTWHQGYWCEYGVTDEEEREIVSEFEEYERSKKK